MVIGSPIFIIMVLVFTTVLVAVAISAGFKWGLRPKHEDTFTQTFKFGLLGGLVGLIIFFVFWYLKKLATNSWDTPGDIGMIPFFGMLLGQMIGVIRLTKIKK